MPNFQLPHINLYYELYGKGAPLVLICGFIADCTIWSGVIGRLSKHFQVLVFDNRGIGKSEAPDLPYSVEMMAEDALGLIKGLGLKKPHILGHSMGGAIAQSIAISSLEIDRLILSNSIMKFNKLLPFIDNSILTTPLNLLPKALFHHEKMIQIVLPWIFSKTFMENKERVDLVRSLIAASPPNLIGLKRQMEAILGFDSTPWLNKITQKTLVIAGEDDLICPTDPLSLSEKIKDSNYVAIPNVGHIPQIEKPLEYSEIVLSFLENR